MKFRIMVLAAVFCFAPLSGTADGQDLIENPDKPLNTNAGRILKLEEELRLTDEGGEFFFQYPSNVKVAPDGSIFLQDRELLLRFDESGNLLHNYYKRGQGPGEVQFVRDYAFQDGNLVVINSNPIKLVTFDFDGELVNDVTIHQAFLFFEFLFLKDGRVYFFRNEIPEASEQSDVLDAPFALISMDANGHDLQEHLSLPYQVFKAGSATSGLGRLETVSYRSKLLLIANTEEYLVKLFDVESDAMLRSFNRKYRRVKPPKDHKWGGVYSREGKRLGPPPPEYFNDISEMYVVGEKLWVRTSTRDENKGYLIDVFDFNGTFVDSFFVQTGGRIVGTSGSSIFIREADEEELVSIAKYRIIG